MNTKESVGLYNIGGNHAGELDCIIPLDVACIRLGHLLHVGPQKARESLLAEGELSTVGYVYRVMSGNMASTELFKAMS
jgi:hypothetical protein